MKKFLSTVCLILIMTSVCLIGWGCKEEVTETITELVKGFQEVCSVTYLDSQNNTTTLNSFYNFDIEETVIDYEEYNKLDCPEMIFTTTKDMTHDKSMEYEIGNYYKSFSFDNNELVFKKWKITALYANYIQIKINENGNLEIIDTQNKHTQLKTSHYEIVYFSK